VSLVDLEQAIGERSDVLGPAPSRAELLQVLTLPGYDRAGRIGGFCANPVTRSFAELLIDAEADRYLRAALAGMLQEAA
jgi:hypothetical protein